MITRTTLLSLLPLFLVAQSVSAKCAPDFRVFSGVVTDKEGKPLPGAMVGLSWSDHAGPNGPALALTDSKGRYTVSIPFDTYSGKGTVVVDDCKHRVAVISLSAFKGPLRSAYRQVSIGDGRNVQLPPAVVWVDARETDLTPFLKRPRR